MCPLLLCSFPPSSPPRFKVNIAVNGSATDIYSAIMTMPPLCRTGLIKSIRVVDCINNYSDIVHIMLEEIYLYPSFTSPRDLCLMRYWHHNSDGSYVICLDSTTHADCPLIPGYVRAHLHAAYVILPPKEGEVDDDHMECLVTFVAQMSPKGWIWEGVFFSYVISYVNNIKMIKIMRFS